MLDYNEPRNQLKEMRAEMVRAYESINPAKIRDRIKELETIQNADGFWDDPDSAKKVSKEISQLQSKIEKFEKMIAKIDDALDTIDIAELEGDESEDEKILTTVHDLSEAVESLSLATLLSGKYDSLNAILTLHAGAGGTEAQDWCSMLYRMYTRYCERRGWACTELDYLAGDEAGIKSVTFRVEGENAYGYLKAEKGVHRLVRISPFDANARRHTSFASLEVMPEIIDTSEIEIRPEDLKVDTYRSSGAGGQHVNKTESAIRITHIPTGIIVACQNERSQIQNREVAMQMLRSKLIEKREREREEEAAQISGQLKKIEWGSQIRSYVFCPYTMVKDHRTNYETGNVQAVMDGDLDGFINEYLKLSSIQK
ncbi:MAG TPA: peptide chain release factor 2 [Clostridiales bacterium]|nr:peptide chain release factor 2 [Clostridiales bacterium]